MEYCLAKTCITSKPNFTLYYFVKDSELLDIEQLMLFWWNPRQYAQNGGNLVTRTIQSDINIDVLPPLVVVFLQFKISMLFPRHMYNDMVLLSTVVLVPFKN